MSGFAFRGLLNLTGEVKILFRPFGLKFDFGNGDLSLTGVAGYRSRLKKRFVDST